MITVKPKNSNRIRLLIAQRGMSIKGFSNKIGLSDPYMSMILNGKKTPSPKTAAMIAAALETSLDELFTVESSETQKQTN